MNLHVQLLFTRGAGSAKALVPRTRPSKWWIIHISYCACTDIRRYIWLL